MEQLHYNRAWAEISLSNLKGNIDVIRSLPGSAGTEIMAVVKADAYGHGLDGVCGCLYNYGVSHFGVACVDEAQAVRDILPDSEVIILGFTHPGLARIISDNDIVQGIISTEHAAGLSQNSVKKIRCHIKIDTGMGRIGLKHASPEKCAEEVIRIMNMKNLVIEGIYTHFSAADCLDEESAAYTEMQGGFILDVYDILHAKGVKLRHIHFMNSAACCYGFRTAAEERRSLPQSGTLVRTGIVMYGLAPNAAVPLIEGIKPVMSLKSVISQVKTVQKGDCISYGRTFTADREMSVATVTIGYGDGYPRLLSSKGEVLAGGKRCRILGRVCMDQFMIDVTGADVKTGDVAVLIGTDGGETITADDIAGLCGTIGYEIVCGITKRVPRFN